MKIFIILFFTLPELNGKVSPSDALVSVLLESSDSLTHLYQVYLAWTVSLHPRTIEFFLRTVVVLVVPTLLCAFAFFRLEQRSLILNWMLFLVGVFLAFELPLHRIHLGSPYRGWFLAFAFVAILTLPSGLAWLLTKTTPWRQRLALCLYTLLLILLFTNSFTH